MEYYSATKRMNCTDKHNTISRRFNSLDLQEIMLGEKRPISKGYLLYDFIYIIYLGWQNFRTGQKSGTRG